MRGRWILVIFFALLALSAQPVAAQNASTVASQHTTFGTGSDGEPAPQTLQNMSVEGSGDSASAVAQTRISHNPFHDIGDGSADQQWTVIGDDAFDNVYKSEYQIRPSRDIAIDTITPNVVAVEGQDYGLTLDIYIVQEGVDGDYREGTLVKSGWDPDYQTGPQDISLDTTFEASAATTYSIEMVPNSGSDNDGTEDALALQGDESAANDWFARYSVPRKQYIDISVSGSEEWSSGAYIGAPHDAERVTAGWANLTLANASATVVWQEDGDGDGSWTNIMSTKVPSTTNITQDLSTTSSDRWRVRVDFEATGSDPVAEIHDEGLLFESSAPSLSDPGPSGETEAYDGDVGINVSDPDFGLAQGDSVLVTATNETGEQIGSQTVTSNGSVTFDYDPQAGENTVTWKVTDEYGNADTLTQNFTTPAELSIFRESENSTKIASATVTLRFYPVGNQSAQVVTKTTTDGTINMTGLPVNQPLVAVANASGYESRRVFIRSLYAQQRMYLLNSSADSVETIFEMRDYSGRYPPDNTVLEIQRSINGDWQTISGDYFGATAQYPATLETGARYRLRLYNPETGATRLLGTYQPIAAQTQTIEVSPQSGLSDRGALPSASVRPQTRQIPARNNTELSVALSAGRNTTVDSWRVIVERNGTTITNTTYAGRTRETTLTTDLANASGTQVNVTVETTLDDGQTVTAGVAALQVYDSPANQLSLLALLAEFVGLAAPGTAAVLTSFVASAATVFVMAGVSTQLPVSGETTALAGVLTLTGFAVIGWVGYDVVFVAGAAVVAFAALRRGL